MTLGRVALVVLGVTFLLGGCGGRPPLDVDDGAAGDTAGCACSSPTISGSLAGAEVSFAQVLYGVEGTWGTHAQPVSPMAVTGMTLLLWTGPLSCPFDRLSRAPFDGPRLDARLKTGEQAAFFWGWTHDGRYRSGDSATLCLSRVPVQPGTPVPSVDGSSLATGCLTLSFGDEGQASGRFAAPYCPDLNVMGGE